MPHGTWLLLHFCASANFRRICTHTMKQWQWKLSFRAVASIMIPVLRWITVITCIFKSLSLLCVCVACELHDYCLEGDACWPFWFMVQCNSRHLIAKLPSSRRNRFNFDFNFIIAIAGIDNKATDFIKSYLFGSIFCSQTIRWRPILMHTRIRTIAQWIHRRHCRQQLRQKRRSTTESKQITIWRRNSYSNVRSNWIWSHWHRPRLPLSCIDSIAKWKVKIMMIS